MDSSDETKKNVGIVGYWFATNYGGVASYYSLYKKIEELSYQPILIEDQYLHVAKEGIDVFSRNFFKQINANISECYTSDKLAELNDLVDIFCVGSDQVFTSYSMKKFGDMFLLKFADKNKKKIAYSSSCGGDNFSSVDSESLQKYREYLERFHHISVREFSGIDTMKNKFGINTEFTIDPIFFTSALKFKEIGKSVNIEHDSDYLLAYVLDPTEDKKKCIERIAKEKNLSIKVVLDGRKNTHEKNMQLMDMGDKVLPELDFVEWVNYFDNASYVFTDSFHGTSMSLIMNKPFIAYTNYQRGAQRFETLCRIFGTKNKLIKNFKDINNGIIGEQIDFDNINEVISKYANSGEKWLKKSLEGDIAINSITKKKESLDFRHCKMLAKYLKAYGIRHVVLSSGTRHVELVRFFEHNDWFQVHNVIDERSAGFYAIGIATRLREPVAVCCTSGTASSNYLSSVSEAYYQHVPVIYITTDRYPYLLNQREAQMVPQERIYDGVCLKEVSLPLVDNWASDGVARRMICDTIMEATHRTPGPVHINVPIMDFQRMVNDYSVYDLTCEPINKINRYTLKPNNRDSWKSALDRLLRSKILIICGQAAMSDENMRKVWDEFCRKFNCVMCTELISNAKSIKSVSIYNKALSMVNHLNETELEDLRPDLVITMNASVSSDIYNFVKKFKNIVHWDIVENGNIADPFKKIKSVFECTEQEFFKRFNFMVGKIEGKDTYYQAWKKYDLVGDCLEENYSQSYCIGKLLKQIPSGSIVHLSNSNTIRMASNYSLNDNVEVFCNRGTNGIDGSMSSFMGQAAVSKEMCYLIIGDLSFFYDMNVLWQRKIPNNIRIMLCNNYGAGLLKHHDSQSITYQHSTTAEGWVTSVGFKYIRAVNKQECDKNMEMFMSMNEKPIFFEVILE